MENDFDLNEWMEEVGLIRGSAWVSPRKRQDYCDVRFRDGSEKGPCWCSGSSFIDISDDDRVIPFGEVTHVRYYEEGIFKPEDDEDREGVEEIW